MGGDDILLAVSARTVAGKAVKHLRRDGMIPAVIHDHGKESKIVMAPTGEMAKVFQRAGKHHPLHITFEKEKYMALIKDVDFDPKKQQMRHVVFNAIKQNEKVETEVPIRLVGDAPAEKVGLLVIHSLDHIEISALPKDLIDAVEVDVSGLTEIGDKVYVSDIKAPAGVTILTEPEHPIAAVEETKAQMSEEAEEAEAAEGAETSETTAEGGKAEATDEKSNE